MMSNLLLICLLFNVPIPKVIQSTQVTRSAQFVKKSPSNILPLRGDYKLFIYNHESGNNPKQWSLNGCVGLGQACPAAKLLIVCPNLDYVCEDRWFTDYAFRRYGGWEKAYYFWRQNFWW